MSNKVQVFIRMISQVEYGEQITQEEFDDLADNLFRNGVVRIGDSIVPTHRIEMIYKA